MEFNAKIRGGYERNSDEAIENATIIRDILTRQGWSLNSICGLLGNIEIESGYNPWRWQHDNVQSTESYFTWQLGYGLTQFSPSKKYINGWYDGHEHPEVEKWVKSLTGYAPNFSNRTGSATDGYAQLYFIDRYADFYSSDRYPINYDTFKASRQDAQVLTEVWYYNYERPESTDPTLPQRKQATAYWWEYFQGVQPEPTQTITLADVFKYHLGAKEWDATVTEIQEWYYGTLIKDQWCATSLSYMSHLIGVAGDNELIPFLTLIGGKNENVYMMNLAVQEAVENWGDIYDIEYFGSDDIPLILKKGDILFFTWDGGELTINARKHVAVCYEDSATNEVKYIGGNQGNFNGITIGTADKNKVRAVYRINEPAYWISNPPDYPVPQPPYYPEPSPAFGSSEAFDILYYLKPRWRRG